MHQNRGLATLGYRAVHGKKKRAKLSFRIVKQQHDDLRVHLEEAVAVKTLRPDLNKRQEKMGTGFLPKTTKHFYIIGSAEALPILCVRYFRWERERDTERERDGSDVTIFALKLAMNLHFPLPKIRSAMSLHFPLPKIIGSAEALPIIKL